MPKARWNEKIADKAQVLWAAMRLAYGKYPVAKQILASNTQMEGTFIFSTMNKLENFTPFSLICCQLDPLSYRHAHAVEARLCIEQET